MSANSIDFRISAKANGGFKTAKKNSARSVANSACTLNRKQRKALSLAKFTK